MSGAVSPNSRFASWTLLAIGLLSLFRVWFAATVELCPDEAYYWTWSRSLALGYMDHPPLVAYSIRLGTLLAGNSPLGVRLGAIVCAALTHWFVFALTRRLTRRDDHAFWVALIVGLTPIASAGAVIHTPDAELSLAWVLCAWFALKAFDQNQLGDWIGLGAALGFACLAKASGWMLAAGVLLFGISCKAGRDSFRGPGPVTALLVAAVLLGPHLLWNAQHGGGSFAFQGQRLAERLAFRPLGLLEFLGGQAGVLSPLVFAGAGVFLATGFRREVRFGRSEAYLLWCLSAPAILLFAVLSTALKVEANWPAAAYTAVAAGMSWALSGGALYLKSRQVWTIAALGLALGLSVIAHIQALTPFLPIDPATDPTTRLRGWRAMATQVVADADELNASIASEGYAPVSVLRYYTGRPVFYAPVEWRRSQYDLEPGPPPRGRLLVLMPSGPKREPALCETLPERWQLLREGDPRHNRSPDFVWWVCEGDTPPPGQKGEP